MEVFFEGTCLGPNTIPSSALADEKTVPNLRPVNECTKEASPVHPLARLPCPEGRDHTA